MPFLTTLGLITGGVSAAQQFIAGASATRRAKQRMEDFEFQDLSTGAYDAFKPSLALETQQLESIERQRARISDVAAGLGGAEAMSLLAQTEDQLGQSEQQVFARQEQLMAQADMLKAQDLQRRQQMKEQRDLMELQGLQQEFSSGQQMMASGLSGFAQLATSAGLAEELEDVGGPLEEKKKFNETFLGKGLGFVGGLFKKKNQ